VTARRARPARAAFRREDRAACPTPTAAPAPPAASPARASESTGVAYCTGPQTACPPPTMMSVRQVQFAAW
jgi:hypothetical protein